MNQYNEVFIGHLLSLINHPKVAIELAIVSGNTLAKIASKCIKDLSTWLQNILAKQQRDFTQLCIVTGCLNYFKLKEVPFFLPCTLEIVVKSCQIPSNHAYQSFQALKLWSLKAKQGHVNIFEGKPKELRHFLDVINANWENPLRGVPDLMVDTLNNLLDLVNSKELNEELWNNTMCKLSWKTKAKYPLMLVLMPRMGIIEILNTEKDFAKNLIESLSSNHLASAGTTVYRMIVKTKNIFEVWKDRIMPHFIHALCHDQRPLVRANCKNHWLNPTFASLPMEAVDCVNTVLNTSPSDSCVMAKCLIIKCVRLKGSCEFSSDQLSTLRMSLFHSNDDVRSAAFGAICHLKKKSTKPSEAEMSMVLDFLEHNINVDNAAFRQVLISDFTQFMLRCRDCGVSMYRRGKFEAELWSLMNGVNLVLLSLFDNVHPDANYQRLITSLELLQVVHCCFYNYQPQLGMNKGSNVSDPLGLVQHALKVRGWMDFYKESHLKKLLLATTHYMIDVKSLASEILAFFSPDQRTIEAVLKKALLLASCSCKFSECESAALLFGLYLRWPRPQTDERSHLHR